MPVPTYDQFIEPLLRYLAGHKSGASIADVYEALATRMELTPEDRAELLPSGTQALFKNRIGWAHDRLKRASLSESPRRGFWKLTAKGLKFSGEHKALPEDELERLWNVDRTLRLKPNKGAVGPAPSVPTPPATDENIGPDERIDAALSDRLGLEKVYVQAKRWKNPVGSPEVQGFMGALQIQSASKGVFITTSTFTKDARQAAAKARGSIVLVDGEQLSALMIDHGVGVSHKALRVPKVDSDYFEEG